MARYVGGSEDNSYIITAVDGTSFVDGGGGTDSLVIDLRTAGSRITGSLRGGSGDPFGNVVASFPYQDISYTSIERLTVLSGTGDDEFVATDAAVTFDGGAGVDGFVGSFRQSRTGIAFVLDGTPGATSVLTGQGSALRNVERVVIETGAGNDSLTGGEFADVLDAGTGTNVLNGRGGDDQIISSGGIDTVDGGAGFDTWFANYGASTKAFVFASGAGTRHTLSDGTSIVNVERINLTTGSASDRFSIGLGGTSYNLNGGGGTDFVTVDWSSTTSRIDGYLYARIDGGYGEIRDVLTSQTVNLSGIERLSVRFGSADDSFTAQDTVVTLDGGAGIDLFTGYFTGGGDIGFTLDTRAGATSTFVGQGTSLTNFDRIAITSGAGNDSIVGGNYDDQINAGAGVNTLKGGGGDDILRSTGTDTVDGGADADTWFGDYASAVAGLSFVQQAGTRHTLSNGGSVVNVERINLTTGSGADSFSVGRGAIAYTLDGRSGADNVTVDWSASTTAIQGSLYGTTYNTTGFLIDNGSGHRIDTTQIEQLTARLGSGNDRFTVTNAAATLDGGAGVDTFVGEYQAATAAIGFTFDAAPDAVSVIGGTTLRNFERVEITTGTGNDTLTGGNGDDRLYGGGGTNTLNGRGGNDVFFSAGSIDTIDGGADIDSWTGDYARSTAALTFTQGSGSRHTLSNGASIVDVERVTLSTGSGNDAFSIGAGDASYLLNAGAGSDSLSLDWSAATARVVVAISLTNAGIGGALTSYAAVQQQANFSAIERLTATLGSADDVVSAIGAAVTLDAGAGTDRYIGSFWQSNAAITFALNGAAGSTSVIGGQGTSLTNVEIVEIDGGSAGDRLTGGALGDRLNGGLGNDTIDGGVGNAAGVVDLLYGGEGIDTLSYASAGAGVAVLLADQGREIETGGAGRDYITGFENLTGSASADLLGGDGGSNVIDGAEGDDTLAGGAGDDTLYGGGGADVFATGEGSDKIWGGAGVNRAVFAGAYAAYALGAEAGTVLVRSGADVTRLNEIAFIDFADGSYDVRSGSFNPRNPGVTINGTAKADIITPARTVAGQPLPGTGADTIHAGDGNDRIDGGAGADTMYGGLGNDTYYVDEAGDRVIELVGEGTDVVNASVSYTLAAEVEQLVLTGSAIEGIGNALANKLTGNAGASLLSGLGGKDMLYGLGGNDTLLGGADDDRLDGGVGADRMEGGEGNDTYVVDDARDLAIELADGGTDLVQASVTFVLGDHVENLTLTGIALIGGTGNTAANVLRGNAGGNWLQGMDGNDTLFGGDGNDRLNGGEGADVVSGDAGDDYLSGGAGTDKLTGGAGADTMEGGSGNDLFLFARATDADGDTILDFATGDRLDLRGIDANAGTAANEAFAFVGTAAFSGQAGQLRYTLVDGSTQVSGDVNGDRIADFVLTIAGQRAMTAADLLL